jgi:hypothetical protein
MDARYPDRYLHDRRVTRLSDADHRAYVLALVWSVANRTDGVITLDDLDAMPKPVTREALQALERAELAAEELAGSEMVWRLTDYATTQTSRAELEALDKARQAKRHDMAARRARKAAEAVGGSAALSVVPSTAQARTGQDSARPGQDSARHIPRATAKTQSKDRQPVKDWPVASIPRSESLPAAVGDDEPF